LSTPLAPPTSPEPTPAGYPAELERTWEPAGGPSVFIRALRPDDTRFEVAFIARLSPETLYLRRQYWAAAPTEHDIQRLLDLDYHDRLAVAALVGTGADQRIVGVSRYAREPGENDAECAIVVADEWHGRGLGTELMRTLIQAAQARNVTRLLGGALAANHRLLGWARRFGFEARTEPNSGGMVTVVLDLATLGG
jgi:acetyltransferase